MAFDIHQNIFHRNGELDEKKAREYQDKLLELFAESPEFQALLDEGIEPSWTSMMIEFGLNYLGVTPAKMTADNLREILFDIFPRKVSAEADEAPGVIRELQAFWQFLQREFHLENAAANLKVLDDKAVRQLKREMNDPANFGIAKSFIMMGMARGYDMSSEEGINTWMNTYNAEIATGVGPRIPLPGEQSASARQYRNKIKRKMIKDNRKRNRHKR